MIDFMSREFEYQNILAQKLFIDSFYNLDELTLLLDYGIKFQIYQALAIIDHSDNDAIESFKKFIDYSRNVIAIRELIERDFNFGSNLIYTHQIRIRDFIFENKELIEKQSPIFKNFENFINFFVAYFINKFIEREQFDQLVDELILNFEILQSSEYFKKNLPSFFISLHESARKFYNEDELKILDDKFLKSSIFSGAVLCQEDRDNVVFDNEKFLEILQKNQMNIAFERAIYLILFDNNLHEYFLDLEERIENYKSKNEIFLMEDESLIEFRELIEKFEKAKIKEEFSRPKTNPIFINRNQLNIDSFLRLQQIEGSKTP